MLDRILSILSPLLLLLHRPGSATAAGKLGLCCMECNTTQYRPFVNVSSWVYRYALFVDDPETARWLAENHVEFVPHLAHKHTLLPGGGACTFDTSGSEAAPLCTAAMLDTAAAAAKGHGLVTKFLMGWNEAYDQGNQKAAKKYIAPADAATYWRVHVQGMAARANWSLVSPTTGVEPHKLQWLGDMILECWAQRSQGCDVETIAAFSVHDYKCSAEYWQMAYGEDGQFHTALREYLTNGTEGNMDWGRYVRARPIWVTETNCNGDYGFPPTEDVSGEEQCKRITGQRAASACGQFGKCGVGSIRQMQTMPTVARVSWWNTWQQNKQRSQKTADAMLIGTAGTLFPPGRALVQGLSPHVDCSLR
jgi:hypothetical protein